MPTVSVHCSPVLESAAFATLLTKKDTKLFLVLSELGSVTANMPELLSVLLPSVLLPTDLSDRRSLIGSARALDFSQETPRPRLLAGVWPSLETRGIPSLTVVDRSLAPPLASARPPALAVSSSCPPVPAPSPLLSRPRRLHQSIRATEAHL